MKHPWNLLLALLVCGCAAAPRTPFEIEMERAPMALETPLPVLEESDTVRHIASPAWETQVAISPANPNIVLASAMRHIDDTYFRCEIRRSEDGGRTWKDPVPLPLSLATHTYRGQADPVLAFDRTGVAYCALLFVEWTTNEGMALFRSTDDGQTWETITLSEYQVANGKLPFDDKEWIAVDNSGGEHDGTVYLAWLRSTLPVDKNTSQEMFLSHSTNGGHTWTPPISTGSAGCAFVAAGADGRVYFSHSGGIGYVVQTSSDGGATLTPAGKGVPMSLLNPTTLPNVKATANVLQQMAVDVSNKPWRGNVYLAYPGSEPGGAPPASVWFVRSADGGATWSKAVRLSAPASLKRDAVLPAIATDPITGDVMITWLDRRDDPRNTLARLYATVSHDGGETFAPAWAVTPPFSIDALFIGHYNSIALYGETRLAAVSDAAGNASVVRITEPVAPARRRAAR